MRHLLTYKSGIQGSCRALTSDLLMMLKGFELYVHIGNCGSVINSHLSGWLIKPHTSGNQTSFLCRSRLCGPGPGVHEPDIVASKEASLVAHDGVTFCLPVFFHIDFGESVKVIDPVMEIVLSEYAHHPSPFPTIDLNSLGRP